MSHNPGMAPAPPMVGTSGPFEAVASRSGTGTSQMASGSYAATDAAFYHPVVVPVTCVVRRMWWANGSTVSASYNIDVGIYADAGRKPGRRLVSTGSTAQGTASVVQFVDVTDTVLPPGLYWLGMACSSSVATFFRQNTSQAVNALLIFQQSSALPLPSTATPVEATEYMTYLFGFATTASP